MRRSSIRGAVVGFAVGLLALAVALAFAAQCLPYRISFPGRPWPWYDTVAGTAHVLNVTNGQLNLTRA